MTQWQVHVGIIHLLAKRACLGELKAPLHPLKATMDSEFDFVVAPQQDRFCPVCTELLTEPFLGDCGHHVCRECHKRIMASGN